MAHKKDCLTRAGIPADLKAGRANFFSPVRRLLNQHRRSFLSLRCVPIHCSKIPNREMLPDYIFRRFRRDAGATGHDRGIDGRSVTGDIYQTAFWCVNFTVAKSFRIF